MQKIMKVPYRIKTLFVSVLIFCFQIQNYSGFGQISEDHGKIRTIVIDAGHGGQDSGALGKQSKEKDVALAVSLLVGKYIEERIPDVKVIYTRTSDVFIPLHERSKIANDAKADLFISIHANSNPNTHATGSETYAMGLHKTNENLEVAKKENSVIVYEENYEAKYEGFDPNDVESYIILSLMQNTYLEQSLNAAAFVQQQFSEKAKRKDRGVKQAGFLVLWETSMPSILIELGFLSNPDEEKYLISDTGKDFLASAIFRAFRDYKAYIEGSAPKTELIAETSSTKIETQAIEVINKPTETNTDPNKIINVAPTIEIDSNKQQEIVFKVQILYSQTPIELNNKAFADFNDVQEILVQNKYKYVVGSKNNYNDAIEYSKWVKSRYPDAFVVAVYNGKIIPLSEALGNNKEN
jgi:N-acetylmuramoyl-L-alanine amidase